MSEPCVLTWLYQEFGLTLLKVLHVLPLQLARGNA
jgi:hypothetical protein